MSINHAIANARRVARGDLTDIFTLLQIKAQFDMPSVRKGVQRAKTLYRRVQ
jgi:hypothetical protein